VIVGLHAERVGLAVAVEEARALLGALRDAQDAVGDVGLAVTTDLQRAPSLSRTAVPAKLHAEQPAWAGFSMGS